MLEDVHQRVRTAFPELTCDGASIGGSSGNTSNNAGGTSSADGNGDTLLVTHGDLAMLYSPTLPAVPDLGKYTFEEAGFLMTRGPHGSRADDAAVVGTFRLGKF
jgi:hypothetical protein